MRMSITIASVRSSGVHDFKCACSGHTRAMMKSLSATAARTVLAAQVTARDRDHGKRENVVVDTRSAANETRT